ncbi:rhodanese-like domain-containing protein [Peijinzhouia sedimentorum]
MNLITAEELYQKLSSGEKIEVIDVREKWEYDEENIGAVNIPLYDLPKQLDEVKKYNNCEIVLHCKTGARSEKARKYLASVGINTCKSLCNGMEEFKNTYGSINAIASSNING